MMCEESRTLSPCSSVASSRTRRKSRRASGSRLASLEALRFAVGVLLVLFGLKWLKKAILRYSGLKAMHDEEAIYEEQLAEMRARGEHHQQRVDPFGVATSFKSVLLEGLEVAFIVITFGSAADNIGMAIWGALAACVLVALVGTLIRAPLQRVPENTLKFVVGIMLTSFGTFWGGEGIGISWWREDLFLPILIVFYLVVAGALILGLRTYAPVKPIDATAGNSAEEAIS